jgi:hypothetical protein
MSAIASKLKALQTLLDGKIEGAPCFIAGDRSHCWEILKNRPGTCKIAVGFDDEKARSNFPGGDRTGRVNQNYYAVISRGRGLNQVRSDNLIYGSGGGKPLFELAEILCDGLRSIIFDPVTDEKPDYVSFGNSNWPLDKFGIDAYEVKIWVGTQRPLLNPLQATTEPV